MDGRLRRRDEFTVSVCLSALSFNHRAYKTIDDEDLKFPLIYGEGKKVRVRVLRLRWRIQNHREKSLVLTLAA